MSPSTPLFASAEAAEDAIAHAKQVSSAQLRPYLFINGSRIGFVADTRLRAVYVELKNFGQTMATDVCIEVRWGIRSWPPPNLDIPSLGPLPSEDWPPGQVGTTMAGFYGIPDDAFEAMYRSTHAVFVLVDLAYTGPGGERYEHHQKLFGEGPDFRDGKLRAYSPIYHNQAGQRPAQ